MNNNRLIEKGTGTYTFEDYIPKIKSNINNLINANSKENGAEILVLNGAESFIQRKDLNH